MKPSADKKKLKIAIVGCGRISQTHIKAIMKNQNSFEIRAVCDPKQERTKQTSEKFKIPSYSSLDALLDNEELDIVTLCSPSGLHSEQARKIAQRKIHVITEKPMATRWKDGLAMVKECDANNVKLFVVKQNRHNKTLLELKKAIESGSFGKIYLVHINVFWTRPQSYYDEAKWRGTWEFDGGALMNQASHYVDLLEWLIGPVEKVHCITSTTRQIEVEDTAVMNLKWRNGALGSLAVTMLTYPKNLEGSITIIGENGTAKIGGVAVNEIQEWVFKSNVNKDLVADASYNPESVYGFGHTAYYENVANCILRGAEAETDGREGLKSLELLVAAYLSARDDRTISLPLEF